MATSNSKSTNPDGAADTPPQSSSSEVKGSGTSNEFVVLTGAITLKLDKEGKKIQRFARGQKVKLDAEIHDIERLLSLKAVGQEGDRVPTAAGISVAAATTNQENPPTPVDNGFVAQSEAGATVLDQGPEGTDNRPPSEQ